MRISLIIAAGGSGSRFLKGLSRPLGRKQIVPAGKLFQPLEGRPVLYRTLEKFQSIPDIHETLVAVPNGTDAVIRKWIEEAGWKQVRCIRGGKTRAESVWNALRKVKRSTDWVMVHDGARPLVSEEALNKLIDFAQKGKVAAAILGRKVIPTIKRVKTGTQQIEATVDRETLYEAETPQMARRGFLEKAYRQNPNALKATDEAGLLESYGKPVHIVAHEDWNPKITTVRDLQLAGAYLRQSGENTARVGFGRDTHRLVKGRKLYLGGIHIPFDKGALGHSDGDALLHAVADAMLGAAGLGDIGEHYSDLSRKNMNIRSEKIIKGLFVCAWLILQG